MYLAQVFTAKKQNKVLAAREPSPRDGRSQIRESQALTKSDKRNAKSRQWQRQKYLERTAAGLCSHGNCSAPSDLGHRQCQPHLRLMAKRARERIQQRKAQGLCVQCGKQPQFWGVRCIICRQLFAKNPLASGARNALRKYRENERQTLLKQLEAETRAEVQEMIASNQVWGKKALALRLYVGLDGGERLTYQEIAELLHTTKQNVHQLIRPAKNLLHSKLSGRVPWAPLPGIGVSVPPPRTAYPVSN